MTDRTLTDLSGDGDVTTVLRRVLSAGPGVVRLPAGTFHCNDVCIPERVVLAGSGPATVLRPHDPQRPLFVQAGMGGWSIRDMALEGGQGDGLQVRDCWAYSIVGVTVTGFADCGIVIAHTRLAGNAAATCDGGTLDRIRCTDNRVGVCLDERAEYVSLVHSALYRNEIGCLIHAGNVRVAHCNIAANHDGLIVRDKTNGSHGVISHCLLNHNRRCALRLQHVRHGMIVTGCCCYYGGIEIDDAVGVTISDCQLACSLTVRGDGANRLHHNYIADEGHECDLSPATRAVGNYTPGGPWKHDRPTPAPTEGTSHAAQ